MKEGDRERGGGNNSAVRSAVEKERTKMRERQRRSITTNIFHGLRKHGGYRLSPRADINEVLRHLAHEAGWMIDPDGTTYRPSAISNGNNIVCPLCGGGRKSAPGTPSSSYLDGAGECSTTTSPRGDSAVNNVSFGGLESISPGSVMAPKENNSLLEVYTLGDAPRNVSATGVYEKGQRFCFLHEGSMSNQNTTPAGSPSRTTPY